MTESDLRRVQMQKMVNPQVVDSIREKNMDFPAVSKWGKPRYSLYKQYPTWLSLFSTARRDAYLYDIRVITRKE